MKERQPQEAAADHAAVAKTLGYGRPMILYIGNNKRHKNLVELFRGYELKSGSRSLDLAEAGLRASGFEPVRTATGGGSDANALIAAGFDCVLLANGTEANHTAEESVSARYLDAMLEVCEAIVAAAGAGGG